MKTHLLHVLAIWVLFATGRGDATDIVYTSNMSLYVMRDVEQGKRHADYLDRPVGIHAADSGAVVYLKGVELYLIRDTSNPAPELIDRPVGDVKIDGGVIVYNRGTALYVRRLSDPAATRSRMVVDSQSCTYFEVKDGKVLFVKGGQTAYLLTDIDTGASVRLLSPVGEPMISK